MVASSRLINLSLALLCCFAIARTIAPSLGQAPASTADSRDQSLAATAVVELASSNSPAPTSPTPSALIQAIEHNVLHRPIELSDDKVHWIERSYPYGGTQLNQRPVHLGVEFINPRFTPVYAAKAGQVVFAGADSTTQFGPQLDYYGNVVVLAHEIESLSGRQIFTLYGHLESIAVKTGQTVDDLDYLGRIGSSGVAIGAHLHFEVRAEDPYDYRMTRNPDLWLQHYSGRGMLIGSLRNLDGDPIRGKRLTVRSDLDNLDVYTYGSDKVNSDPVWDEDFAISDLEAGDYEVLVLDAAGLLALRFTVSVEAYRTTEIAIVLDA